MDRLAYSAEEVGQLLGASGTVIQRFIDAGEIPSLRISEGACRVRRTDLADWLDELDPVAPDEKTETP